MSELITTEAVAGLLTPTALFVTPLVLHLALPAVGVDGYAHGKVTGTPRRYPLSGMLVFVSALLLPSPAEWSRLVPGHPGHPGA